MSEAQASSSRPLPAAPRAARWPLWQLRPPVLAFVLGVDLAAILVTATTLVHPSASTAEWLRVAAIAAAAVLYGEACDRIERIRRYLGNGAMRPNHLSVWTVAALVVAPAGPACIAVIAVYAHVLILGHRHRSIRPHRMIFTGAAAVFATWAGSQTADSLFHHGFPGSGAGGAAGTLTAVAVFFCLDTLLIAAAVALATGHRPLRAVLPQRDALLFEIGTQLLGVLTAQLLVRTPWLAPAGVAGLVAMHRASLVKQLQIAADTDPKTGLLNAVAWRRRAEDVLRHAIRERLQVALIVVDLDHFKRVNDEHGHLAGDQVLRGVGALLRDDTRGHDLACRFGGEEFLILIEGRTAAAQAVVTARRLRAGIAALELPPGVHVTASLGVAHIAPTVPDLDAIMAAADAALYAAKAGGRDRVHAAPVG